MSIIKPVGHFRGPEAIDKVRRHLEPAELSRLFAVFEKDRGPFWYGYFRIQYYFGCRMSEVALILKEDVSFKDNAILIRRLKKKQFKKMKGSRIADKTQRISDGFSENVYGLNPMLVETINAVLKVTPRENPWLFGSKRAPTALRNEDRKERMASIRITRDAQGQLWRAVSRDRAHSIFKEAAQKAGIPEKLTHTHVLRHTRATLMLAAGVPPEKVMYLLGHTSLQMTHKYMGIAQSLRLKLNTATELAWGDLEK